MSTPETGGGARRGRRPLLAVLPVLLFLVVAGFLYVGLYLNPREIPSALIGKPAPTFALPAVEGRSDGLANADFAGQVAIVNVFASWCGPCLIEHPLLMGLAARKLVPIYGINYKDPPDQAAAWLARHGDPYTRIGADRDGRVGIDWGVYGVPETYVVDAKGTIVFKHVGPLTPEVIEGRIVPMIESLRK
jgi:cytochrome c biogenesis protein CcmG/thiol:disulfide interchange protein DsbE